MSTRADLTVVSGRTGQHISIRMRGRGNDGQVWVDVSLTSNACTMVFVNRPGKGRNASNIGRLKPRRMEWVWDASATDAEKWAAIKCWDYIRTGEQPDSRASIMEAVPCQRCGELLYDPQSIATGIGPTCNRKRTTSKAARSGAAPTPSLSLQDTQPDLYDEWYSQVGRFDPDAN